MPSSKIFQHQTTPNNTKQHQTISKSTKHRKIENDQESSKTLSLIHCHPPLRPRRHFNPFFLFYIKNPYKKKTRHLIFVLSFLFFVFAKKSLAIEGFRKHRKCPLLLLPFSFSSLSFFPFSSLVPHSAQKSKDMLNKTFFFSSPFPSSFSYPSSQHFLFLFFLFFFFSGIFKWCEFGGMVSHRTFLDV